MFCLLDVGHVLSNSHFSKHVEASENALVGEVEVAVAVVTVFLNGLLFWTLLSDVPLLLAVVAEMVVSSVSK